MQPYRKLEYYIMSPEENMTPEILLEWLGEHQADCKRFSYLRDLYEGRHPIQLLPDKPPWKPDNRIVVNFAKYITDTMNGYFIGIPIKTECGDAEVLDEVTKIRDANDQDDNDAELSKICSIYGSGFELVYLNEASDIRITYFTPLEAFVIYDDSVERKPLYGVRYYYDRNQVLHGMLYTRDEAIPFTNKDGFHFVESERKSHPFDGVPLIEYLENEERQGIFEQTESMITAYEKAISEKANDVDAFADAYLVLIGLDLEEEDTYTIRQDRVIQVKPMDAEMLNAVKVEFLSKPSGDTAQENLLNRLETQIFTISMVANISDEEFGGSSGTALAYKLQPMKNLAQLKARKFASGMNQRWRLIASLPITRMHKDAWAELRYHFTQNAPRNLLEEAQTASQLAGITSKKTQLSVISAVQDVGQELNDIEEENAAPQDIYRAARTTADAGTAADADAEAVTDDGE